METFRNRLSGRTAVKYLLSYLIIISVLILGFFFILKKQITDSYFEYRSHEAQLQLKSVAEQFGQDLLYLSQIDSTIVSDMELIEGRYKDASTLLAIGELREYAATTQLIQSIVYMPKKLGIPISTQLPVSYVNDCFVITDPMGNSTVFDPTAWLDARTGQLIFLSEGKTPYLIYFPAVASRANYIFFYILDTQALQKQFKSIVSEETLAVALTDSLGQAVMGVNTEVLRPYLSAEALPDGVHQADESFSLCIQGGINQGFTLVSLLSRDFLSERINEAFASSYLALIGLSLVGFLLVILAMRITYLPLQRLTRKIVPDANSRQGYLNQLESAFSRAELQQRLLRKKLDNYRLSIQKSLLDTLVFAQYPGAADSLDMDALFDPAAESRLYILQIKTPEALPWDEIQQALLAGLPETGACILLEPKPAGAVFLLNYTGSMSQKDPRLRELLTGLHRERGCLCAVSNGSDSPLDIPVLYENAAYAASFWPRTPVAVFPELPLGASAFAYPHESLNRLTSLLSENHFSEARCEISRLFGQIDLAESRKGNLTDFFVQCVLTDILTRLTNFMNLSYIRFADYSDLYFKTLHLCRGGAYGANGKEIRGNMEQLLDFCEQAIAEKIITAAPLIQIVEESYCQPDFSITALADRFHVSTAYMSQLFKKELNVNFSDYLWSLRQKKAQTLLRETELPIEEVSLAVGYVNTSSFRRKFKQETGITPSQYRADHSSLS